MTAANCPRFLFTKRPLWVNISDCAGADVQVAFINLLPYPIVDTDGDGKMVVAPALFICDGMSMPDITQGRYQADEGISAGGVHDWLYSIDAAPALAELAGDEDPRKIADEVMGDFLLTHCPGYMGDNASKAYACELGVRIGGGKSFHDPERDVWRREVATRLFAGKHFDPEFIGWGKGYRGDNADLDYGDLLSDMADRIGYPLNTQEKEKQQ